MGLLQNISWQVIKSCKNSHILQPDAKHNSDSEKNPKTLMHVLASLLGCADFIIYIKKILNMVIKRKKILKRSLQCQINFILKQL